MASKFIEACWTYVHSRSRVVRDPHEELGNRRHAHHPFPCHAAVQSHDRRERLASSRRSGGSGASGPLYQKHALSISNQSRTTSQFQFLHGGAMQLRVRRTGGRILKVGRPPSLRRSRNTGPNGICAKPSTGSIVGAAVSGRPSHEFVPRAATEGRPYNRTSA